MSDDPQKIQIPPFQGIRTEGTDQRAQTFMVPGTPRSKATGAAWASTGYNPMPTDPVGNLQRRYQCLASIETQARTTNENAGQDDDLLDLNAVMAGARETMDLADQNAAGAAKQAQEQQVAAAAAAAQQQEEIAAQAQQAQQRSMIAMLLPWVVGVGAGLSIHKATGNLGHSLLAGAGALLVTRMFASRLAGGIQSMNQSGAVPALAGAAQLASLPRRIA